MNTTRAAAVLLAAGLVLAGCSDEPELVDSDAGDPARTQRPYTNPSLSTPPRFLARPSAEADAQTDTQTQRKVFDGQSENRAWSPEIAQLEGLSTGEKALLSQVQEVDDELRAGAQPIGDTGAPELPEELARSLILGETGGPGSAAGQRIERGPRESESFWSL